MSEKIYSWLLRLFPSDFRDAYGDAALQLFRDRSRHERGFLPRLRLWLDLLADLAISVPRQRRYRRPALIAPAAQHLSDGTPSFQFLEDDSPRFGALLLGGALSLAILGAFPTTIGRVERYRPLRTSFTSGGWPASMMANSPLGPLPLAHPPKLQDADALMQAAAGNVQLEAAERERIIQAAMANLKQYYIDPAIAQKTADALLAHEKNGDDDSAPNGQAFADLLTKQMRDASHDMHLMLVFTPNPTPLHPIGPTPDGLARYKAAMEQQNCTFEKVETLPHNIGYFKLNSFPDTSVCQSKAEAAMASLNHAKAIIFDLRDNTGGFPDMVALIAAYLFDHPEYFYNPRENTTEKSWTHSPISGNNLAGKPVYVLTSARTFSGAEQFCYNMKMLKRATR